MNAFSKKIFNLDLWMSMAFVIILVIALSWHICADAYNITRETKSWWCHVDGPATTTINIPNSKSRANADHDRMCDRALGPSRSKADRERRDREIERNNKAGTKEYARPR